MENYHWDYFTRSIFINAPRQKVFDAWTIPSQIETWFLERADFADIRSLQRDKDQRIQDGDSYEWKWWNYPNIEKGRVQQVDPEQRFIDFLFVSEKCPVRVIFREQGNKTLVSLSQSRIPLDDKSKSQIHMGCSQGWSFWMVNLKAWLEHGVLLHEREKIEEEMQFEMMELINR
ncbi:MAG: SRPBCC domain-containing protein [Bacteroidota bacterium]